MEKLDFNTFIQILLLIVTGYIAFQNLLPVEKLDLVSIILFWILFILAIIYSILLALDIKLFQKLKKIDKLENDINRIKEFLDYKKMTEDLNIRLKIIENKMDKKGILSPQTVVLILIVIILIIYILRRYMYG